MRAHVFANWHQCRNHQFIYKRSKRSAPVHHQWIAGYKASHPAAHISYDALGSGAGLEMFKEGKFVFAASDVVTEQQLKGVSEGAHFFPMTAGNVVVCFHLPEIKDEQELKLSREAAGREFSGLHHVLGRRKDYRDEQAHHFPQNQNHRGSSFRRQRHHLRIHRASESYQRRMEERPRRGLDGPLAHRKNPPWATTASPNWSRIRRGRLVMSA